MDVCNFCDIMQGSNFTGGTLKQQLPALCQAFRYQPSQIFSQNDFSIGIQEMLKATVFQYLPMRDPVVLTDEPENPTPTLTWKALPIEESEAQTRAQSSTMVPDILWIGLNSKGKHQSMQTGCVSAKGAAALSEEEPIQSTHSDDC